MTARTQPFAGLVAGNRYAFGGLEDAVAVAVLTFSALAAGNAAADPLTQPFAGLISGYRPMTSVSVASESAGTAGVTFSATGASSDVVDLTEPFAGLISGYRQIGVTPTTSWSYDLSAALNANVEDISEITAASTADGTLVADVSFDITIPAAGAGGLTFAAAGRAGMIGTAGLTFSADGHGVGVGSPFSYGAGEGRVQFTAAGVIEPTWPIVLAATLQFAADGASAAEARADGTAGITFSAVAGGYQDGAGAGAGSLTFTADGNSGQVGEMAGEGFLLFNAEGHGPNEAESVVLANVSHAIVLTDETHDLVITDA